MFLALGLSLVAAAVGATPAMPQNGVEYEVLARPQPAESGKKIEVVEFFAYFCPHCYALEPLMAEWVKKQGDNIVFKRVHVNMHGLVTQQKLHYTLDAMGKLEEFHMKVFNAYHIDRNRLQTDAEVMEFVAKSGLDKQKFQEIYNSFAIQSKVARAAQMSDAYHVDGVPNIAIDGRYVTSPVMSVRAVGRVSEDAQNRAVLQVMDYLVAKIQKERNVPAAAEPAKAAGKKK
ncbi:MAG: thiol:disulfide interchange protein DsbA/DsbL [Burkholderiales bacterium]|nr:thiol:disulfide interchange protein DsbA/DsbL [Burkholderiales bacterium]